MGTNESRMTKAVRGRIGIRLPAGRSCSTRKPLLLHPEDSGTGGAEDENEDQCPFEDAEALALGSWLLALGGADGVCFPRARSREPGAGLLPNRVIERNVI